MARGILVPKMLRIDRGFPGFRGLLRGGFALCALALLIPTACGSSEDDPPNTDPSDEGRGGDAGRGGSSGAGGSNGGSGGGGGTDRPGGAGGDAGETGIDPLAPVVTITSPEGLEHPDDGAVLTGTEVQVICEAAQSTANGSRPVNPGTVVLQMLDADGQVLHELPGEMTERDEFTASFVLTPLANGVVSFRCSASDISEPALTTAAEISTFVDQGPAIEVISPAEDSAQPVMGAVAFSFTVTPAPLVDDDGGAEVDVESVSLDVLGLEPDLEDQGDGSFATSVAFGDPMLFPDTPASVTVIIRARNTRMPVRAERTYRYSFVLDGEGPIITKVEPLDEDVRGGEVTLKFTITDAISGVDPSTVSVSINNQQAEFFDPMLRDVWSSDSNGGFAYTFDTTQIQDSQVQATINYGARDMAGNSSAGESLVLYLDNVPPLVDLDPPLVREMNPTTGTCSLAFDPVGAFAANDLAVVQILQVFRAIVIERTNGAAGQRFPHFSGTDQGSVQIFVQPDVDAPLLVDKDMDGVCDEVDRTLRKVDLKALTPQGQSWFGPEAEEVQGAPGMPQECTYEDSPSEPQPLCEGNSSDLTRVVRQGITGMSPAIYAIGNLEPGVACTGVEWEIGAQTDQEGWLCVAARAQDNAGNVGVSRPLRLCFDDGVGTPPDCSGPPPSCAQNECVLPDSVAENTLFRP